MKGALLWIGHEHTAADYETFAISGSLSLSWLSSPAPEVDSSRPPSNAVNVSVRCSAHRVIEQAVLSFQSAGSN